MSLADETKGRGEHTKKLPATILTCCMIINITIASIERGTKTVKVFYGLAAVFALALSTQTNQTATQ